MRGFVNGTCVASLVRRAKLPRIVGERRRDLRHWKHEIDRACHDCVPRHAVVDRFVGVLCDGEPAFLFDRLQPEAAVGSRPRKDNANGALGLLFRQRA